MEIAVSVAAAVITLASAVVAAISLRHSRSSAAAAHASAEEAKRANNLQAEAIREAKQANLKLRDSIAAVLDGEQLRLLIPVVNMGLSTAHNIRCNVTIGEQITNVINKLYQAPPIESMAPGKHLTIVCMIPPEDFRHFTGRVVVDLIYDDLDKTDKLVQRSGLMNGSHQSGVYSIRYT